MKFTFSISPADQEEKLDAAVSVLQNMNRPSLVLMPTQVQAEEMYYNLKVRFSRRSVEFFSSCRDCPSFICQSAYCKPCPREKTGCKTRLGLLRRAALDALRSRRDVIVVTCPSCICELYNPKFYDQIHPHSRTSEDILPRSLFLTVSAAIEADLKKQLQHFCQEQHLSEKLRLQKRVSSDLELLQKTGTCPDFEHYYRYFPLQNDRSVPYTLLDYFEDDFFLLVDDPDKTFAKLRSLSFSERSRNAVLVENGAALPLLEKNRPLTFAEFQSYIHQAVFLSPLSL